MGLSERFLPGIADFSYCLNKWRYRSMGDPAILAAVSDCGAKCFQLDFLLDHEVGESNRREIGPLARQAGIELTGADYGAPSKIRFERQIAAALELGIRVVRHAWGPFLGWQEPLPPENLERELATAARLYEAAGLFYALENHQDYPSSLLAAVFRRIGSKHIGIFLDTGNSIALLESPVETAEMLAPFVLGVHAKEYAVLPAPGGFDLVGVPLNQGVVDNAAILQIVAANAPDGRIPLLLENPLERCPVDLFAEPYRRHLGERSLHSLSSIAALMDRSRELFPRGITLPHEDPSMQTKAIQEAEIHHNRLAYRALLSLL